MSNLLEITSEDISLLKDSDLRDLIGLLCEADYSYAGLSTNGIFWGGNQDASDGGLDVVVRHEKTPSQNSYIPRNITGFQVKKPKMPPSQIFKEMKPNGKLRNEIKLLIQEGGAYIIISSGDSASYKAINARIEAMREAVADEENYRGLLLEFYDSGRIASWVRSHSSLILWIREKIGRQLIGWQPYANWSHAPENIKDIYLWDDNLRVHDGTESERGQMSAKEGLQRLRSILSIPGRSVRITGLSGVGKTRFVQALFDDKIGEKALNPLSVFYADISDNPIPDPKTFAELLIAENKNVILVIDNCNPELHSRLTDICVRTGSTVTLLSIEYDIRDDISEETKVFRLEPSSLDLIEKLISIRFPNISQIDARTIADFSGGNARIAIALANTVKNNESLSCIRNEELFKRLFWQRKGENESLLESGKACSLVYSFEGTDVEAEKSELKILASLVGKSAPELYKDVQLLKERELIQSRDKWRAVLPHALANRLAQYALKTIPGRTIVKTLFDSGSDRLIKSFSRRLSYLHESIEAIDIVKEWLAKDGWLGKKNCRFDYLEMEIFRNIAPVCPEYILKTMEHASNGSEGAWFTSRDNSHYYEFVHILQLLAYESELFGRSVELISRFALSEKPEERYNSSRDILKPLFYPYYSGTKASVEVRANIIVKLLNSKNRNKQDLGLILLVAALECWSFSTIQSFDFGARSRDYGYYPKTQEEVIKWYKTFIDICIDLAISSLSIAKQAKKVFADKFRGLWTNVGIWDGLEQSARKILEKQAWNEGWMAVRDILRYDSKELSEKSREKLYELEELLKPKNLIERARAFALTNEEHIWNLVEDFEGNENQPISVKKYNDIIYEIGTQVAQNSEVFHELLPEIVSTSNSYLQFFGKGLADNCNDKQKVLNEIYSQFKRTQKEKQCVDVLLGFLSACAESDREFYNSKLDHYVNDEVLGEWFPILQKASIIDQRGIERLHKSLEAEMANIYSYKYLAWGRAHESICDDDLANLLQKILMKEGGIGVVIEILKMRFHEPGEKSREYSEKLLAVAKESLSMVSFSNEPGKPVSQDYGLAQIANVCLKGTEGQTATILLCKHLAEALSKYKIYPFDYPRLLSCLSRVQPIIFLDAILEGSKITGMQRKRLFSDDAPARLRSGTR
jgi:hypothetical protein